MSVMDTDRSSSTAAREPRPELVRVRWPIAAAGLLVVMVGLLVGAFLVSQRFGPRIGTESGPASRIDAAPASPVLGLSQPTAVPTPAPAPAFAPSPVPSIEPTLRREIETAYAHYWDVRAQALFDLDASSLAEVMAGDELAGGEAAIRELRAENRAAKADVQHSYRIIRASSEEAAVYDEYKDFSTYVDPVTKQQLGPAPAPSVLRVTYHLRKIDGQWKVVGGERHE